MLFPLKIAPFEWEIALFYTNFDYKFSNLWSKVEGSLNIQKMKYTTIVFASLFLGKKVHSITLQQIWMIGHQVPCGCFEQS